VEVPAVIRCFVRHGLLGENVEHIDLPMSYRLTSRRLLDGLRNRLPQSCPIGVAVDGRLLEHDHELDAELVDGQQVVLLPQTSYGVGELSITAILVNLAISLAISYVAYLLSPRPKAPGLPQQRGDDSSQTYAWDGIKTNYGPGLPIPWVYGNHALGGQGIWTDIEASRTSTTAQTVDDRLRLILSLCEGPIYQVGGIAVREANALGSLPGTPSGGAVPSGITINGNLALQDPSTPGFRAWVRSGDHDQSALPAPLAGVSSTYSVGKEINPFLYDGQGGGGQTFTYVDGGPVSSLRFVFTFPAGLYQQLPTGALGPMAPNALILWRVAGATTWNAIRRVAPGAGTGTWPLAGPAPGNAYVGYHAATVTCDTSHFGFPVGVTDPIEFNVSVDVGLQGPQQPSTSIANATYWRDLVVVQPTSLRYPLEALLGLELQANSRFSGSRPQVSVPVKGALVRVWDATNGWSPRCWEVPAAPFNFNTYPPGRNPAWCLLDFLTARWGLGRWITESQIDLPAFRAWAAFCDSDPNPGSPWGEAQCTIDVVGDTPRAVWDWILTFCSAGRAAPIMRDGKISVVYHYRDAHGDAGLTVPAKAPVQLLTEGNCEDATVEWLTKASRPTLYDYQFLNEQKNWAQDALPVEDEEGTQNDPSAPNRDRFVREVMQAWGVTRPSQIYRDGRWTHRLQRLVRRKLNAVVGPWALGAEVGDLIDYQSELLRPFGTDVPVCMQVIETDVSPPSITVDHHVAGTGLQVVVRDPDGAPQKRNVSSYTNTTHAGRPVAILVLASAVTVNVGATCVVGLAAKLTQTYEMASISLRKDLKREFTAVEWTPDAYDPITVDEYEGAPGIDIDVVDAIGVDPVAENSMPASVLGIRVVTERDGTHTITWARPGSMVATRARVYVQPLGFGVWTLAGSTDLSEIAVRGLRPNESYVISVCLENLRGSMVPPDLGDQVTVTPEEFPPFQPPKLTNVRATTVEDGVLLEWDDLGQRDLEHYEVRAGSQWAAAAVLARPRAARVLLDSPPAGVPFLLAAKASSGMFGPIVQVANPGWTPRRTVQRLLEDDLAPSPAGTHTNTQWNSTDSVLELATSALTGTYESVAQDMGFQADFYWQVQVDAEEWEDLTVAEADCLLSSGEARWRLVSGRPASPANPGLDWRVKVSDFDIPVRDLPPTLLARGFVGVVGSHTQVLVESRFYVNGAWTSYRPHVDRIVVASRMQVRLTFGRRALRYRARARRLTYAAYL
jgi:hypothetical protein